MFFVQVFPNTILQTYSVKHHSKKYQNAEHYAIKQLLFFKSYIEMFKRRLILLGWH